MGFTDIVQTPGFTDLTEAQQVERLRASDETFASAYQRDPDAALGVLRKHAPSGHSDRTQPQELNQFGEAVRQAASGFGESFTNTAQSIIGLSDSKLATGINESIDEFEKSTYSDPPTTAVGRIARRAGEYGGYGLQFAAGAGAVGTGARAAGLARTAKVAEFLSGSLTAEGLGGAAAGAAGGAAREVTDNPVAIIGAEILAGGAVGIGIAARHRAKMAARAAASGSGSVPQTVVRTATAATEPQQIFLHGTTAERAEKILQEGRLVAPEPGPARNMDYSQFGDEAVYGAREGSWWFDEAKMNAGRMVGTSEAQVAFTLKPGSRVRTITSAADMDEFAKEFGFSGEEQMMRTLVADNLSIPQSEWWDEAREQVAGSRAAIARIREKYDAINIAEYEPTDAFLSTATTDQLVVLNNRSIDRIARTPAELRAAASVADGAQPPRSHGQGVLSEADAAKLGAYEEATTNELKGMLDDAAQAAEQLPPGSTAMTPEFLDAAEKASAQETMDTLTAGTRSTLDAATHGRIVTAGTEIAQKFGLSYDPRFPLMTQLAPLIKQNPKVVQSVMDEVGVTTADVLADAMQVSASESGRLLQQLSVASRKLNKEMLGSLTPEQREVLYSIGVSRGRGFWKRLEDSRRGLLVTQLATAMRNAETQVANLTVHGMEDSLTGAILKLFPEEVAEKHVTHGLGTVSRLVRSMAGDKTVRRQADLLGDLFPGEVNPLLARYSSDIANVTGLEGRLAPLEKLTHSLNFFNRFQEFGIRRAAFTASLDAQVKARGASLARALEKGVVPGVDRELVELMQEGLGALETGGRLGDIPRDLVETSVGRALELTWGKEFFPDPAKGQAHNLAAYMIGTVNRMHIGPFHATQVIPFPRFLANAIKWQYERSPMPLLQHVMSPDNWARLGSGQAADVFAEAVPKAVRASTGLGLFLAGHQLRNSEWAGEKWYEIRPPAEVAESLGIEPGTTLDARVMNPFASFLFAADVINRMQKGTLDTLDTRQIAMGLLATNLRAGAGMYVLDQFLDGLSGLTRPEDAEEAIKMVGSGAAGYVGSSWSGMLVPMQQLRDIVTHFDESQAVVRDTGASPLTGPFQRRVPYADETLPEVQLPTREAPPLTTGPVARQLTGATLRGPKNPAEREFDRLGFTRSNILPSSGDENWDRLNSKYLGPLVENVVAPLVSSDAYKNLPDPERKLLLGKAMSKLRAQANRMAAQQDPKLYLESRIRKRSKPEQQIINRERRRTVEERSQRMEEARNAQ